MTSPLGVPPKRDDAWYTVDESCDNWEELTPHYFEELAPPPDYYNDRQFLMSPLLLPPPVSEIEALDQEAYIQASFEIGKQTHAFIYCETRCCYLVTGDDQKGRVEAKWLNLKYELIVYTYILYRYL